MLLDPDKYEKIIELAQGGGITKDEIDSLIKSKGFTVAKANRQTQRTDFTEQPDSFLGKAERRVFSIFPTADKMIDLGASVGKDIHSSLGKIEEGLMSDVGPLRPYSIGVGAGINLAKEVVPTDRLSTMMFPLNFVDPGAGAEAAVIAKGGTKAIGSSIERAARAVGAGSAWDEARALASRMNKAEGLNKLLSSAQVAAEGLSEKLAARPGATAPAEDIGTSALDEIKLRVKAAKEYFGGNKKTGEKGAFGALEEAGNKLGSIEPINTRGEAVAALQELESALGRAPGDSTLAGLVNDIRKATESNLSNFFVGPNGQPIKIPNKANYGQLADLRRSVSKFIRREKSDAGDLSPLGKKLLDLQEAVDRDLKDLTAMAPDFQEAEKALFKQYGEYHRTYKEGVVEKLRAANKPSEVMDTAFASPEDAAMVRKAIGNDAYDKLKNQKIAEFKRGLEDASDPVEYFRSIVEKKTQGKEYFDKTFGADARQTLGNYASALGEQRALYKEVDKANSLLPEATSRRIGDKAKIILDRVSDQERKQFIRYTAGGISTAAFLFAAHPALAVGAMVASVAPDIMARAYVGNPRVRQALADYILTSSNKHNAEAARRLSMAVFNNYFRSEAGKRNEEPKKP